ncbi:MAG: hypothetical protein M3O70_27685, partial [Actinomycetota bacterium]|nr:hypothetical protein [Actinomycetota bacterium]
MNGSSSERWAHARRHVHEALTLVVGRPRTKREMDAAQGEPLPEYELLKIRLNEEVADAFRQLCYSTIDRIQGARDVDYEADSELASDEVYVLEDEQSLRELALFREAAETAATADPLAPKELDVRLKFYAVVAGDQGRIAFVRKTDPQLHHKFGGFLVSGRDRLAVIEGPLFGFAPDFDFVVAPTWAAIVSQHRFEQLFRETGLVARHVADWVKSVTEHLPMPDESVKALQESALRDSRLWRRLRAIHRRGHLRDVSIDD